MPNAVEKGEGAYVTCPKCGQVGILKIDTFKAGGKEYKYWVVRHGAKRCVLQRYGEAAPPAPHVEEAELQLSEIEREEEEEGAARAGELPPPKAESYPRELQRRAWYTVKIASSVGALKENPTRENFERLKNTAAQIAERLGVPTADLIEAAERYLEAKSETAKMKLNETATLVACRILSSLFTAAEKGGKALAPAALAVAVQALEEKLDSAVERLEAAISSLSEKRGEERLDANALAAAIAEEVAKRIPVSPPVEPTRRPRAGGLKRLILEILSDGRERTRKEIERELEERYGVKAAPGPLSGRLSELARDGKIVKQKREGVWYWAMVEQGGSS